MVPQCADATNPIHKSLQYKHIQKPIMNTGVYTPVTVKLLKIYENCLSCFRPISNTELCRFVL